MRLFQLALLLFVTELAMCQAPSKPGFKPATTVQNPIPVSRPGIEKPDIKSANSYSPSWLRSDMDAGKVILAGSWLTQNYTGYLFQDPHSTLFTSFLREGLFIYPDLSEGGFDVDYITPIDRGQLWNQESLQRDHITVINIYDGAEIKKAGWRIDRWPDGSISLISLRYGAYLALRANGSDVIGELIDTSKITNPMNIKFLMYGLGKFTGRPISFYHPGSKTFLGIERNNAYQDWITDAFSAQSKHVQKLTVKFKGYPSPTAFDFGQDDRNTIRSFAPGESTDKDGDGHKSEAAGGDDCDDNDPNSFPGNPEKMDSAGHDEDCICNYELVDKDHDGFYDIRSFNVCKDGTIMRGDDCDDNNPAIKPGAVIYVSETEAEVCGRGKVKAEPGTKFMRQPNGLATAVPKN